MTKIFVSHSQYDTELLAAITHAISDTTVQRFCMEFENYDKRHQPPYNKIHQEIFLSSALFLLLGENLRRNEFTQNWVSYEVGLAHGIGRPIWVFEEFDGNVQFPVPYLNHFVLFRPEDKTHIAYIKKIAEEIGKGPIKSWFGSKIFGDPLKGQLITCPNCKLSYGFYSITDKFLCPSCRTSLHFE